MAKFWFAKQHKLETFDHDIKVVLGVYCLLSRHAYENMFNLKPLVCLVTEPPGVSCVSAGDRELSPAPLLASVPQWAACCGSGPVSTRPSRAQSVVPRPSPRADLHTVTSMTILHSYWWPCETPCGAPASAPPPRWRCWPRCCRWPPPTGPRRPRTSLWPRSPTCQTASQQVSVLAPACCHSSFAEMSK